MEALGLEPPVSARLVLAQDFNEFLFLLPSIFHFDHHQNSFDQVLET